MADINWISIYSKNVNVYNGNSIFMECYTALQNSWMKIAIV